MEPQQMSRLSLVVNAEDQGIALAWEEDFDWVVGVTAIGEHLELGEAGLFEKFEFGGCFWEWHIAITFFHQKLLQHLISKAQTRAREGRSVFPSIAGATEVVAACLGELLAHGHMGLRRRSILCNGRRAFFFPFFHETKFVVLQQGGSKFGQK